MCIVTKYTHHTLPTHSAADGSVPSSFSDVTAVHSPCSSNKSTILSPYSSAVRRRVVVTTTTWSGRNWDRRYSKKSLSWSADMFSVGAVSSTKGLSRWHTARLK